MNEVLKQRLVGALILVALGVIFWPIVFVQPESPELTPQQSIPPAPGVATSPVPSPDPVGLRASPQREPVKEPTAIADQEPAVSLRAQPSESDAKTDAKPASATGSAKVAAAARQQSPEPLALDGDGVPVAWILQVASVSSEEKAEALRKRLLGMDKKAYVKRVSSNGRTLYRVYIGPKFEQAKLEAMRADIDAEFGVQSIVRRYLP